MERKQVFTGKHADVTDKVLKAYFKVYDNELKGDLAWTHSNSTAKQ